MAEPDALRAFADALLAPLDAYDRDHHGELVVSLQAFLQHNARWETAAAQLFVHRHTLRYRMRKVEELTGRDLASCSTAWSSGSRCAPATCCGRAVTLPRARPWA